MIKLFLLLVVIVIDPVIHGVMSEFGSPKAGGCVTIILPYLISYCHFAASPMLTYFDTNLILKNGGSQNVGNPLEESTFFDPYPHLVKMSFQELIFQVFLGGKSCPVDF